VGELEVTAEEAGLEASMHRSTEGRGTGDAELNICRGHGRYGKCEKGSEKKFGFH
jgi:hypothetical protein